MIPLIKVIKLNKSISIWR